MTCDNISAQIDKWFDEHRSEMVGALAGLVSIPSVAGESEEGAPCGRASLDALQAAAGLLEKNGFTVKYYDNCVISADLNSNEPALAMLAHVDVVPAGDG